MKQCLDTEINDIFIENAIFRLKQISL